MQREICVSKSIGLACSEKKIYHFCFVLLCTGGQIPSTSPRGGVGLYSEGRFDGGVFLRYDFGGLIFGGAYIRNFTVCLVIDHLNSFLTVKIQHKSNHGKQFWSKIHKIFTTRSNSSSNIPL